MQAKLLITLLFVAYASAVAPILGADSPNAIPGRYIVVFHPETSLEARNVHLTKYQKTIIDTYEIETFRGFAADLADDDLEVLMESPDIKYIEADRKISLSRKVEAERNLSLACGTQTGAVWGLTRISQKAVDLNGNFQYDSNQGAGVNAYVIDTGILTTHTEFTGRVSWGANYAGDGQNTDCNGHGTHVAGTIAGTTYGVAKKTTLIAVKVLNCSGSGTNSGVISGINWVTSQHKAGTKPSVANMSLGGGASTAVDDATSASITAGVVHAVAAGNENAAACNGSPARVATAITVGATTVDESGSKPQDARASFSNYGTCVSLFAPGELIKSAWIGSNTATKTISGTSMATPHVAGVVALQLALTPNASPASIKTTLINNSNKDMIKLLCPSTGTCSSSPNRLLYTSC